MELVTLEQARNHVKSDGDDDTLLTLYVNAAEKACARECNRDLFPDAVAMAVAIAAIPATLTTAFADYDAAMAASLLLTDARLREVATDQAAAALLTAKLATSNAQYGMVATDDVLAAILLTVGHLYTNREDNVTGQGAAAVQLPRGAAALLAPCRRVGSL